MKKLLLSAAALVALTAGASAADLPSRSAPAPAIAAVPVFTWTGFYVGVQAGYTWSDYSGRISETVTGEFLAGDLETDGFVGGAHAGFNLQTGSLVFGVEGDIEFADLNGDRRWVNIFELPAPYDNDALHVTSEINVQGSIRGRIGFAFDRALIYATGGLAFANFENEYTYTPPSLLGLATESRSFDNTEWGWTVGAGVEYAFTNNLTARVEYRYTQFDNSDTASDLDLKSDYDVEQHAVRVGVSFKF